MTENGDQRTENRAALPGAPHAVLVKAPDEAEGSLGATMVPTDEQLARINQFTRTMATAENVVTFSTLSCNDIPDRDDDAFTTTRQLALKEGLFVGMSSGAAVWGALEMAKRFGSGTIVVILPDRGDRYLSTALFTSVCAKCPP